MLRLARVCSCVCVCVRALICLCKHKCMSERLIMETNMPVMASALQIQVRANANDCGTSACSGRMCHECVTSDFFFILFTFFSLLQPLIQSDSASAPLPSGISDTGIVQFYVISRLNELLKL